MDRAVQAVRVYGHEQTIGRETQRASEARPRPDREIDLSDIPEIREIPLDAVIDRFYRPEVTSRLSPGFIVTWFYHLVLPGFNESAKQKANEKTANGGYNSDKWILKRRRSRVYFAPGAAATAPRWSS
jgi:hypothetical protein